MSRKNIIITESQLDVIREFENKEVLHYEFESKVRKYMEQLKDNPCKPKYDEFFVNNNIPEKELQNKMIDLGIIIKKSDKITEPEDANGNKKSMHSRKFIFSGKDFDKKIDKLYNTFFKNGERMLKECDAGGAMGGGGFADAGGATTTDSSGDYQYNVPFGGVQRRKIEGVSGTTKSNIDMSPALDRKPGKVAVNH